MKKTLTFVLIAVLCAAVLFAGCSSPAAPEASAPEASSEAPAPEPTEAPTDIPASGEPAAEATTMLVAAAASLEYALTDELIPLFQEAGEGITIEGTYDSSGKLQTQIEEGLEADVFMSAATKQMDALVEQGLVDAGSVVELLENEIVLIAPADSDTDIASFEDIANADTIAIGDPESVPAGQYAQEALTSLGIWDEVVDKSSLGTNVTEVLNWVAEGSADVGIVYATDAATTDKVKILAVAPEGSLEKKVIYPVGIVTATANPDAAAAFIEFLQTPEAIAVFEAYGFKSNL